MYCLVLNLDCKFFFITEEYHTIARFAMFRTIVTMGIVD